MHSTIRTDIDGHLATVWLHRPHRRNAWTGRMHAEFRASMAELERDDAVRVVIVTGTPPAFCVGGDSQALADHADRGSYDPGLPPEPDRPGIRMRAEFDDDFDTSGTAVFAPTSVWLAGEKTPDAFDFSNLGVTSAT